MDRQFPVMGDGGAGEGGTLISIVVPVYNEEANVRRAYEAIRAELEPRDDLSFEIVFTDNHSTDRTFDLLREIAQADPRVKVIRFARNFGFNRSIMAGYRFARGDAAIQIDCDLEDPPQLFHDFIRLWREGHDVVVGVRARRQESPLRARARNAYYRFLDSISETPHQMNAGDFRLVDRSVLNQLALVDDAQPYMRGLISELARNQGAVPYERTARREFGESKFPARQLLKLALQGVFAHSTLPLKLATYIGLAVALLTATLSAVFLVGRLLHPERWPVGYATTTILILFGISLNGLFLGVIGEYIARIYDQVRTRPTVIVERAVNLDVSGGQYREEAPRGFQ
ncbi:MAG TPA: glycosyltransferase family 2 protein [Ramlibacter sp.]|uniref:glycosyltransferase family 2 protein n=1 Tax=Ramlibacter sp. TaxID=1917967 RepID=UPI002ED69C4D